MTGSRKFRCPCGRVADAVHLLDEGVPNRYPRFAADVRARFSCPAHDWGGYCIEFSRWSQTDWYVHLAAKIWRGDLALIAAGIPPALPG